MTNDLQVSRLTNLRSAIQVVISTGVIAYFTGGFVAGMVWAKDCGNTLVGNLVGRWFIGIVMCILSALNLGFPPQNEGGVGPRLNAWPFIFGVWFLFLVAVFAWNYCRRDSQPASGERQ